jgi:hypothetical protein
MAQIGRRLTVRDGCATPRATTPQLCRFEGSATKRNHGATARNHGATEAQPAAEDRSATAQPAAYKQPVRLRIPEKRKVRRILKEQPSIRRRQKKLSSQKVLPEAPAYAGRARAPAIGSPRFSHGY